MKTQAESVAIAKGAIGQRKTSAHGFTNPYGAQCVAMIAWQDQQIGGRTKIMPGYNAIDVYTKNPLGYPRKQPNEAQPGDYHFMNYVAGGKNFGHTGVVIERTAVGIWSVDQNWNNPSLTVGSPAARIFHPLNQLVGLLRPPYSNQGGDDMKMSPGTVENLYLSGWQRPATAQEHKDWDGKEMEVFFYNGGKAQYDALWNDIRSLQKRIAELEAGQDFIPVGDLYVKKPKA